MRIGAVGLMLALLWTAASSQDTANQQHQAGQPKSNARITYRNTEYGFRLSLPASWEGFEVVTNAWHANADSAGGPELLIRHPDWDEQYPRQDIPIMIFTRQQWQLVATEKLIVSAAPFPPGELDHNKKYVFAIPPRYNYAFPEGYEEVEQILGDKTFFHAF